MPSTIKILGVAFAVLFIALSAHPAHAWGQNGHRIVGEIAFGHLTETTKLKVLSLLKGDKLAEVSTWADEMRSAPEAFWQKEAGRWHYINLKNWQDFKASGYPMPFNGKPKDIYGAILKNITALRDPSLSEQQQGFHLRFLIHLVGDLHMPLHVGMKEDRGGNRVRVKYFGRSVNLHQVWDTEMIESQRLSYKDFAEFIDTQNPEIKRQHLSSKVETWMRESFDYRDKVYQIGDGKLGFDYNYQHMPMLKLRLQQSGIRLAGLLNAIYDPNAKAGVDAVSTI